MVTDRDTGLSVKIRQASFENRQLGERQGLEMITPIGFLL